MSGMPARVSVAYEVVAAVPLPGESWLVMGFHDNASERYVVKRVSKDGTEGEGKYRSAIDGASNCFLAELASALGAVVGPAGSVVVAPGDRTRVGALMQGYSEAADEWDNAVTGESDEDPDEKAREMRAEADDLHNALIGLKINR